jgi:LysM repeat protein
MNFTVSRYVNALLLVLACLLCGCLDSGQDPLDEEREPQFIEGRNRVRDLDYKGAIESFQKTLEINPRHAEANYQLGQLFEKEQDPAAAIYHYESYLRLRPNANNADSIKGRIYACKQELARTVSFGPVTQTLQREFENMVEENKHLKEELAKWRTYATQLQTWSNQIAAQALASQLEAARAAQAQAQAQALPRSQPTPSISTPRAADNQQTQPAPTPVRSPMTSNGRMITPLPEPVRSAPAPTSTASYRTHSVKSGETPTTIARRYGVSVNALLSANPRVDPRRMKVGTVLRIPAS